MAKVLPTTVPACPTCGKLGWAWPILNGHGAPQGDFAILHKVSDGSHSGLFVNEIMESCGPFSYEEIAEAKVRASD